MPKFVIDSAPHEKPTRLFLEQRPDGVYLRAQRASGQFINVLMVNESGRFERFGFVPEEFGFDVDRNQRVKFTGE